MNETIQALPDSVKILLIIVLGYMVKEWWEGQKYKSRTQDEALNNCTNAIIRLEVQMKNLNDTLLLLPKMSSDISAAHDKIRTLQKDGQ